MNRPDQLANNEIIHLINIKTQNIQNAKRFRNRDPEYEERKNKAIDKMSNDVEILHGILRSRN